MDQPPVPDPPSEPKPEPPEKRGWFPKIETAADFVVILFAVTVAICLFALVIGVIIAAIKGADVKGYFSVLTSIMTSIISALVGYLAGRSIGKPPEPPTT